MRAATLRHRVILQSSAATADGGGGAATAWSDVATLWASIEPLRGAERMSAQQLESRLSHRVRLRHRDGVTTAMRLKFGTRSQALAGGIGWATEQARKRSADIALVEVRGRLVAEASNYVIERVPDALNHFGLDREGIEKLIEARLGGA